MDYARAERSGGRHRPGQGGDQGRITYPALGLVSEAGEVAGKFKKYLRDGGELPREALLDELSDVCWYCAVIAHEHGWDLDIDVGDAFTEPDPMLGPLERNIAEIADSAAKVAVEELANNGSQRAHEHIVWIVLFVSDIAGALGSSLPEVLGRNIAKLASRQARGVIGGSGDTR